MKRFVAISILLFFVAGSTHAQFFNYHSDSIRVDFGGYYAIAVSPDLMAIAKPNLSDIRLVDDSGFAVPFFVRSGSGHGKNKQSHPTKMRIAETYEMDYEANVELEAPQEKAAVAIELKVKNNNVQRKCNISQSSVKNVWTAVTDANLFTGGEGSDGTYSLMIWLPKTVAKRYRITTKLDHQHPMGITEAYIHYYEPEQPSTDPLIQVNPTGNMMVHDSNRHTYVKVLYDAPYPVNRLQLSIIGGGPYGFERNASVLVKTDSTFEPAGEFLMSSRYGSVLEMDGRKAKELLIVIDNKDDRPLPVNKVTTWSQAMEMVASLQKERHYVVLAGCDTASAPEYDIVRFKDSINVAQSAINLGAFHKNKVAVQTVHKAPETGKVSWLWIGIVGGVGMLIFATSRMMRDVKKAS